MKTAALTLLLALGFFSSLPARSAPMPAAATPTVQVSVQKKSSDALKTGGRHEGSEAKKTENAAYQVTLRNISMGDLPALTVDYILFVERQKLGEKKSAHPFLQRKTGSLKVDALPRSGTQVVTTEPVELVTENLVGTYHFLDGGRIRAEDSVAGVWVRVSQAGQMVGEYAMPSTITSKGWENKLSGKPEEEK